MIRKLKLTYFRKHEDLTLDLSEGLVVIRGSNEAGKSTTTEAIAYALYGSSALRNSVEETVTWGRKPNEMRVELQFGDYTFVRSKAAAEVLLDGKVYVTGQKEVTTFAASLLGADATTANHLMFAHQGGLRGVLNEGPKGTGTLLEAVAGLEIFDRLLESAGEKLPLGSTAAADARLATLREQKERLAPVAEPDRAAHTAAVTEMETQYSTLEGRQKEVQGKFDAAQKEYVKEIDLRGTRERVQEEIDRLTARAGNLQREVDAIVVAPQQDVSVPQSELQLALAWQARKEAWSLFSEIHRDEEPGSREAFTAHRLERIAHLDEVKAAITDAERDLAVAKASLITSSVCGFCGQDVSQFPEAKAKNDAIEAEISRLNSLLFILVADLSRTKVAVQVLDRIVLLDADIQKAAARISTYVTVDDSFIPAVVAWKGGPVHSEMPDIEALRAKVKQIEDANTAAVQAAARRTALTDTISGMRRDIDKLRIRIPPCLPDADYEAMVCEVETLRNELIQIRAEMDALSAKYSAEAADFNARAAAYDAYVKEVAYVEGEIAKVEAEVADIQFNNALIKKLRAARPVVTNKLWNMVLASVSSLFSRVRGEKSLVERGAKSFTVNGQSVDSLSGSTLDILGLCVRVALIKTFMPGCPFIIADEPGQGCDANRVANMLGFLSSVGFKQTLLITHDPISENFADQLIEV